LLPLALRRGISANLVSLAGLALGISAAVAYWHWQDGRAALLGFVLMLAWLVADGLDGMVARATNTASAVGRVLDGICDHGVFILVYCTLATSIGTAQGWALAVAAGAAHAMQSSLYESERYRFHRRVRGDSGAVAVVRSGNILEKGYDAFAGTLDRMSAPFDRLLRRAPDPKALGAEYGRKAVPVLRFMALLTANVRVIAIFVACLAGSPLFFWWFELVPLSAITIFGIAWHRRVEAALVVGHAFDASAEPTKIRLQNHSSR
jgi:phosphatidylglycerophosphate synthase